MWGGGWRFSTAAWQRWDIDLGLLDKHLPRAVKMDDALSVIFPPRKEETDLKNDATDVGGKQISHGSTFLGTKDL